MLDFKALKWGLETFEAQAVNVYYQTPEHEEVVVEPAGVSRTTDRERHGRCVEIETTAATATIGRAELGGALWSLCGAMLRHLVYWKRCPQISLELHMVDIGGSSPSERKQVIKDLS